MIHLGKGRLGRRSGWRDVVVAYTDEPNRFDLSQHIQPTNAPVWFPKVAAGAGLVVTTPVPPLGKNTILIVAPLDRARAVQEEK